MTCPESEKALAEFVGKLVTAAQAAGAPVRADQIHAELLAAPHKQPTALPRGKQAIYWFCLGSRALKIGRARPNSGSRYTSQHYNPRSSQSNLAKSILRRADLVETLVPADAREAVRRLTDDTVGDWIKLYTTRINLLLGADIGKRATAFIESLIHQWFDPVFEGPSRRPTDVDTAIQKPQGQPNPDTQSATPDDLGRWRRCLRRLLEAFDGGPNRGRGLKPWIVDLSREGRIPRHIASAMILVAETRNVAEYEAVTLSQAEAVAARSCWQVVLEWARSKRLVLPPECEWPNQGMHPTAQKPGGG